MSKLCEDRTLYLKKKVVQKFLAQFCEEWTIVTVFGNSYIMLVLRLRIYKVNVKCLDSFYFSLNPQVAFFFLNVFLYTWIFKIEIATLTNGGH